MAETKHDGDGEGATALEYATPESWQGERWLPRFLWPPAAKPQLTDAGEIKEKYQHLRVRILFWTTVGYGAFYLVRKNLAVAQPIMETELGLTKSALGLFLTLHGVLYGISKFFHGFVGDRADGRKFMAVGLIASAVLNVCFGLSGTVGLLGIFWMANGWFQGMGYPPCARLLTHWFGPKELARKMAVWNASHTIGSSVILSLCWLLLYLGLGWRACFFVPALLAIGTAGALLLWLRDTPESVGLPEVAGTAEKAGTGGAADEVAGAGVGEDFSALVRRRVFSNKYIWLVSAANFFVYTLRYAVFDWGTTILKETKHVQVLNGAWMLVGFELAGWIGVLMTGWLTDKVFGGRGARVSMVCMVLAGVTIFCFWKSPGENFWMNAGLLMAAGFFIYGPQSLVAVVVANLATKRAAATAVGLTSIFGYASTVLSGWGIGTLVKHYADAAKKADPTRTFMPETWDAAFVCLLVAAGVGAVLFALALPAKADGYGEAGSS